MASEKELEEMIENGVSIDELVEKHRILDEKDFIESCHKLAIKHMMNAIACFVLGKDEYEGVIKPPERLNKQITDFPVPFRCTWIMIDYLRERYEKSVIIDFIQVKHAPPEDFFLHLVIKRIKPNDTNFKK